MSDSQELASYGLGFKRRRASVLARHPELREGEQFKWWRGWLGDPFAGIWFIGENPSLGRLTFADAHMDGAATPEMQWAVSPGDKLFRRMLHKYGFKGEGEFSHGGWNCYLTNVMKSAVTVNAWQRVDRDAQLATAVAWAPVLQWELAKARPRIVVAMGRKSRAALEHLQRRGLIDLPQLEELPHWSYIASRPEAGTSRGPNHPDRIREYGAEFARIRKVFKTSGPTIAIRRS